MDYKLNEKYSRIWKAMLEFSKDINSEAKEAEGFSRDIWRKCCQFGIMAMLTPKSVGGMAETYSDILTVAKIIGYAFHNSGFVFAINNSLIVASYLLPLHAGNQILKECYPALFDGGMIAAYAITEADSGSDAFHMNTTYELAGDQYILNGTKTYISNATIADLFLVVAKDKKSEHYSIFCVKKGDSGFQIGREIKKMGLEACPMGELVLCDCKLSKERVVGKEGNGMLISNLVLDWERTCSFASHLGTMERILEECISYVNIRKEFSKSIGNYQLVSEKIAKMKIDIELGNLLLKKIADLKDKGRKTYLEASIFKYFVGESYAKLCTEAMQIYGAYGYSKEGQIEQEVRDSLAAKIYSGTSEIQLEIIAKMIGVNR